MMSEVVMKDIIDEVKELLEYQIGDLFIVFWSIFVILFVISFLGPKKNFMKIIGNIFQGLT